MSGGPSEHTGVVSIGGDGRASDPSGAAPRGFLNPYFQLFAGALLVTVSELLLKRGATGYTDPTGLSALASWWVWGGIACYILSFVSWLHVLRHVPLIVAFNLMNAVHVLIPISSWLFLGEVVPPARWAGIALITLGLCLIAKPLAKLEERL